jgi:hypothetical protein
MDDYDVLENGASSAASFCRLARPKSDRGCGRAVTRDTYAERRMGMSRRVKRRWLRSLRAGDASDARATGRPLKERAHPNPQNHHPQYDARP